ncbi:hypothetical protein SPRG_11512 [Saprolegnia parasitica CBS 223.65]|uniref:Uncharacterized protein n=1 Tax=Saprolegnia parasitica (strain CBS 223.65) TaxID=695850 RepID=A0A067BXZ7_SAPPC|nr:hypothetical protein SPRG_11512 [Saprolegnia parasitica CBS 223.65]KDO23419.1 hypothetical protein SPRG_11512 [Saprolegnia parasitica CBS 223.65]|eukprot:XP_012205907.1 hypothetical protein SPRG_11512 [Saprolegnia parasitica CBS 223.65]
MHFSGHGTTDAALLFEFDDLSGDLVYVEQLAKFFQSAPPRLVVLLACHSEKMAPAFLAAGVKHVIAVSSNWAMAEDAVNVFARSLYTMLGRGCGIDEGFNVATSDEADHFVLLPRGADHSAVIFPEAFDDSDVLPGDPFPPLRADYLPKEVREYKERQLDEGDICSRLAGRKVHVAWLHGPSNVGKTQLACSAARALQLTPVFARGVTFISVEDIAETCPGVANDAVLDALKLQVDAWLAATTDRSSESQAATLIVLDGVDALVASRAFVTWLDKICRSKTPVHFLVTSRAISSHVGAFKHPSGLNPIKIVCHTTLASNTSCRRRIDPR